MTTSFLQMQDEVLHAIGLINDSTARTLAKRWLNRAKERLWGAYPWPERRAEGALATTDHFDGGTVSISRGSATAAFVGVAVTPDMVSRKLAKSILGVPHRITAEADPNLTIDPPWADENLSTSTYVIYQDEYDLETDVGVLRRGAFRRHLTKTPILLKDDAGWWHERRARSGVPEFYRIVPSTTFGVMRVQFDAIPESSIGLRYDYLRLPTVMSSDASDAEVQFLEGRRQALIHGALPAAYRYNGEYSKARAEEEYFKTLAAELWKAQQETQPGTLVPGGFDAWDPPASGVLDGY